VDRSLLLFLFCTSCNCRWSAAHMTCTTDHPRGAALPDDYARPRLIQPLGSPELGTGAQGVGSARTFSQRCRCDTGTAQENHQDAARRGRQTGARREAAAQLAVHMLTPLRHRWHTAIGDDSLLRRLTTQTSGHAYFHLPLSMNLSIRGGVLCGHAVDCQPRLYFTIVTPLVCRWGISRKV
jgi:hypothetical protein